MRVWDLTTGQLAHELQGHTEWVFGLAVSPDGRRAYSCGGGFPGHPWASGTDLAVRVWDLDEGREVRRLEGHAGLVWSVAASPDGRHVLSGGFDATPILWDAATGAELGRFRGHTDKVLSVTFLPDGRRAVTSGMDKTVRIWDVETCEEVACLRGHPNESTWVAASPDGCRLLSSDVHGRELRLWNVNTCTLIHRINWCGVGPTRVPSLPTVGTRSSGPEPTGSYGYTGCRLPPPPNRPPTPNESRGRTETEYWRQRVASCSRAAGQRPCGIRPSGRPARRFVSAGERTERDQVLSRGCHREGGHLRNWTRKANRVSPPFVLCDSGFWSSPQAVRENPTDKNQQSIITIIVVS